MTNRTTPVLKHCFLRGGFTICITLLSTQAMAFRPFESTDASVTDFKAVEVEVGILSLEREIDETSHAAPSLTVNYGLMPNIEVGFESGLEKEPGGTWKIAAPALASKFILKPGVLQDQSGLSVAVEVAAMLPTGRDGEKDPGGEAVLLVSGELAPVTYHVNFGGGIDREGNGFWNWGIIGELPLTNTLTLAGEVTGENAANEKPENSTALAFLFQPEGSTVTFDLGVRRGISHNAPDWGVAAGLTVGF